MGLSYETVDYACSPSDALELPDAVRQILTEPDSLLITSTIGGEIAGRADLIEGVLDLRPDGSETVLIVCENDRHSAYDNVEERFDGRLEVCRSVVDRVCAWPKEEGKYDSAGRRLVRAHPVGEWVVHHPDPGASEVMRQLATAEEVLVTADPLDPWYARKLWIVNGLHMVLALIARDMGSDELDVVAPLSAFQTAASELLTAIDLGLRHEFPDLPADPQYGVERVRVFQESPDNTWRILEAHLVRSDLRNLMRRTDARVADAARAARHAGDSCESFHAVFELLLTVLQDPGNYYESDAPISRTIDDEVEELFARALDGWADPAIAVDMRTRLTRLLESQRDLLP